MKKNIMAIFIIAIAVFLWAAPLLCADIAVTWQASAGATGYKLEYSANDGATWTAKDVGTITPTDYVAGTVHLLQCAYTWTGLPDTGLILVRVTAYNAVGQACRVDAGSWFNKSWSPPAAPKGVGIQ